MHGLPHLPPSHEMVAAGAEDPNVPEHFQGWFQSENANRYSRGQATLTFKSDSTNER